MGIAASAANGRVSRRRFLKGAGTGGAILVAPALWIKPGFASEPSAQVHLEFGADPSTQMVVSWSTSAGVSRPRVRLGTREDGLGRVVPAETRSYVDGLSGTEVITHHGFIEGLKPDSEYIYKVLHDGAEPISGHFRTAPRGRERFRFTRSPRPEHSQGGGRGAWLVARQSSIARSSAARVRLAASGLGEGGRPQSRSMNATRLTCEERTCETYFAFA
jgi:purple acid phosphatase-like protein